LMSALSASVSKAGAGVLASADEDTWGVYVGQLATCNVGPAFDISENRGKKRRPPLTRR
jgi:hypothetical protein